GRAREAVTRPRPIDPLLIPASVRDRTLSEHAPPVIEDPGGTAQQPRLSPRRDIPASAPGPVVALSVAAILRREQAVEIRVLHPGAWRPGKVTGEEALDSVHAGAKGMLEQPRTRTDPAHASLTQGLQRGHSG